MHTIAAAPTHGEVCIHAGHHLDGLQYLAFHCLLHDEATVSCVLVEDEALTALEELVSSASSSSSMAGLPHILRVLHSSVSRLARLAGGLKCLHVLLGRFEELRALTAALPDPCDDSSNIEQVRGL